MDKHIARQACCHQQLVDPLVCLGDGNASCRKGCKHGHNGICSIRYGPGDDDCIRGRAASKSCIPGLACSRNRSRDCGGTMSTDARAGAAIVRESTKPAGEHTTRLEQEKAADLTLVPLRLRPVRYLFITGRRTLIKTRIDETVRPSAIETRTARY